MISGRSADDLRLLHIAAIDLFVVPTIGFELLYGLVILRLARRRLVWTNVTANPTAEWIARPSASPRGGAMEIALTMTATPPIPCRLSGEDVAAIWKWAEKARQAELIRDSDLNLLNCLLRPELVWGFRCQEDFMGGPQRAWLVGCVAALGVLDGGLIDAVAG